MCNKAAKGGLRLSFVRQNNSHNGGNKPTQDVGKSLTEVIDTTLVICPLLLQGMCPPYFEEKQERATN